MHRLIHHSDFEALLACRNAFSVGIHRHKSMCVQGPSCVSSFEWSIFQVSCLSGLSLRLASSKETASSRLDCRSVLLERAQSLRLTSKWRLGHDLRCGPPLPCDRHCRSCARCAGIISLEHTCQRYHTRKVTCGESDYFLPFRRCK